MNSFSNGTIPRPHGSIGLEYEKRIAHRMSLASSTPDLSTRTIAYFSMEIALSPSLPTYSGGLGMLAGDTLRSAADTAGRREHADVARDSRS